MLRTRITLAALLATGLTATLWLSRESSAGAGSAAGAPAPLQGVWIGTVAPDPATGVPPFSVEFAFTPGGVLTESSTACHANSAGTLGFNCNDGHGAWEKTNEPHTFAYTFWKHTFDPPGGFIGFSKVRGVLVIDPRDRDRITGDSELVFVPGSDPDGAEIFLRTEFTEARRVRAEL